MVSNALSIPLLLLHAGATLFMTGLCWFVQVVHYPLYARVGVESFRAYEAEHVRRTGRIVAPVMALELACAAGVLIVWPSAPLGWIGAGLLALVWASTWGLQVPRHRGLAGGFDPRLAASLVATNWIRTIAWSARSVVALVMLAGSRS